MNGKKILPPIKMAALVLLLGGACGVIGTLFSKGVSLVTDLRGEHTWLIYLLPLAGLGSVALYRWLRVTDMGTNQALESADGNPTLSAKLAPAIFGASLLSHLCGASVGREGAALQLGGSAAHFLGTRSGLDAEQRKLLVYCGMAGVFSSVFGTPLAAAIFALEVVVVGRLCLKAVVPALVSSFVSYGVAVLLGAHAERFPLSELPALSLPTVGKVLLLSLLTAGISMLFCLALKYAKTLFKFLFKNAYLRIAVGGTLIVLLTVVLNTYDYNGAGIPVVEEIFTHNQYVPYAFALKMLFTCIAIGAGYKGGEIVPTLFIGATFGALVGGLLGLPVAFGAAIGMIALFCGVTNCPLASLLLAVELFSGQGVGYMALAVIVSYCLSGKISLYSSQKVTGLKKLF